jgi:hypothetical protein
VPRQLIKPTIRWESTRRLRPPEWTWWLYSGCDRHADRRIWISTTSVGLKEDERAYQPFRCVRRCDFLVSSATLGKRWRDVDVRLILDNDYFIASLVGYEKCTSMTRCGSLISGAIAGLAKQVTGPAGRPLMA